MDNKEEIITILLHEIDQIKRSLVFAEQNTLEGFDNKIEILEGIIQNFEVNNTYPIGTSSSIYWVILKNKYRFNIFHNIFNEMKHKYVKLTISSVSHKRKVIDTTINYFDLEVINREQKFKQLL